MSLAFLVDPSKDPEAQGDPFTTLFLSRLDYSVTEKDLQREFEMYGPIARIRIVADRNGKSRGYAFIVYEKERDMRGKQLHS
jgi:U1 small nuclear ribonucleoprotein